MLTREPRLIIIVMRVQVAGGCVTGVFCSRGVCGLIGRFLTEDGETLDVCAVVSWEMYYKCLRLFWIHV